MPEVEESLHDNLEDFILNDQEVQQNVELYDKKVAQFCTERKRAAEALSILGQQVQAEDKENATQKKEELEADVASAVAVEHRMRDDQNMLEEQRRELERKSTQEGLLPPEQQRLQRTLEQQQQILAQRESVLQQAQQQKDTRLSELQRGCDTYRGFLGLDFERVGDERLRLIFTQIDERNPKRVFCFQVFVDPNDHYHIERCEPTIPAIDALTESLNSSNDFSAFVRGMRREFKLLAAQ